MDPDELLGVGDRGMWGTGAGMGIWAGIFWVKSSASVSSSSSSGGREIGSVTCVLLCDVGLLPVLFRKSTSRFCVRSQ